MTLRSLTKGWNTPTLVAAAAIGLAIYCLVQWLAPPTPVARSYSFPENASWIRTADTTQSTGCFRSEFKLDAEIANAWVAVTARDGFELMVNGDPADRFTLWRPTRPFQNGLSASGQRLATESPAMALNFPREYQWSLHNNSALPVWIDITSMLRRGENVLCVEVESRSSEPAMILAGEVLLADGRTVPIASGAHWIAEPVPAGVAQQYWTLPDTVIDNWRPAVAIPHPTTFHKRLLATESFTEPFTSSLLVAPNGGELRHRWDISSKPEEATARILATGGFDVWINGELLSPPRTTNSAHFPGSWKPRRSGRGSLINTPELLDPDEIASLNPGTRIYSPAHGDPTENDFKRFDNTLNRTRDKPSEARRSGLPGSHLDPTEKGSAVDPYGVIERPEGRVPAAVTQDRRHEELLALGLHDLLKRGENEIRIRPTSSQVNDTYSRSWSSKFAFDVGWRSKGEWQTERSSAQSEAQPGGDADWQAATVLSASVDPGQLPKKKFLGNSLSGSSEGRPLRWALLGMALFLIFGRLSPNFFGFAKQHSRPLAAFAGAIALALLIRACFAERSEALFFHAPTSWPLMLGLGLAFAIFGHHLAPLLRVGRGRNWIWLTLILATAWILRAHAADAQPLDDDEYASVQAVLSIVERGYPEYAEGVWYTRSPLYHYTAAGVALVFGDNILVLRLWSVALGIATCYLVFLFGKRILRSEALGLAAAAIYAVHPFLIFTAHIARFYQQQQFFTLLAVYLFIRGFVQDAPGMKHRYGAMLAIVAAILSQEISLLLLPAFGLAYILFAQRRPWPQELRVGFALGLGLSVVFLDLVLFKLKCLTITEGVSPNVEATLKPHFWQPLNVLSIFIGYSRLHLLLSAFMIPSLARVLKRRETSVLCLYFLLGISIVITHLVVTSVSFRYQYSFIPIWILLGLHGVRAASAWLFSAPGSANARLAFTAAAAIAAVVSFSPWRILPSYDEKILGDSTSAFAYVKANQRPGDKVMATEPHPHAALLETGQADYDLAVPILYDFAFRKDGVLIDRNGSAEVVGKLGKLQEICAENDRLWIAINREKFRNRGKNLRWEYPGARIDLFLRKNTELKFRGYLWHVYLWDANAGKLASFRQEPKEWAE